MAAVVKRQKPWAEKVKPGQAYPIDAAIALVKEFASAKFDEAVDVAINLGIDPAKSDQQVRGSTVMPNGTGKKVRNAKAGQVRYRCDKAGIVHCTIGKASFTPEALKENLVALIADIQKHKPSTSKGVFLQRVSVSSTMGPGIGVDRGTLGV